MSKTETAVLIGATGSFGQVITAKLLSEGLQIVAVGRDAAKLAKLAATHKNIIPCVADITSDDAVNVIKAAIPSTVRIAVSGPGVKVAGGIMDAPLSALVDSVNIKVGGMVRLARAVDEFLMPKSRLVAIGGHYGLEPTAYAASAGIANAALVNLMRQLSLSYGARGITAHLLAPGPADTEILRRVAADRAAMNNTSVEEVLDSMKQSSSLLAFSTPEQVAWAVSILLAPEADAMTGSTIFLDSGRRRGLP